MNIRKKKRFRWILFAWFLPCFFMMSAVEAKAAYIDPSVMTYAIQAIAGVLIGLGTFFSLYWRKVRKLFFGSSFDSCREMESDKLEFHDPDSQKTRSLSFPEPKQKERGKLSLATGILLAFTIRFLLCFFSPFNLYFTNISEFRYDIYAFGHLILLLFLAAFAVIALIYFLGYKGNEKVYLAFLVLGMIALLGFYIEGNFLAGSLPIDDGSKIQWNLYPKEALTSILTWAVCAALCIFILWKTRKQGFEAFTRIMCSLLSLILVITLAISAFANNGLAKKDVIAVTNDELNVLSKDRNFILMVIDAADAHAFSRQLETTDPDYADIFEDFTYYPDTLAAYPYTLTAVPHLLTGIRYEAQSDYRTYFIDAIRDSGFLNTIRNEGYTGGMYDSTDFICDDPVMFQYENIKPIPYGISNTKSFLLDEISVIFYLHVPWPLKRFRENAIYTLQNESPGNPRYFEWYDDDFYEYLKDHPAQTREEKTFRYIHLEGAHPYYRLDKNLNDIRNTGEPNYDTSLEAACTTMDGYLKWLKEAGVYDNSVVIILGDHGFPDGSPYKDRHNAVFLVKGLGERHPFAISDKAMSYDYLPAIYDSLLQGKTGEDIYPFETFDKVKRRYLWHDYNQPEYLVEFEVDGKPAGAENALEETGRVFEKK